MEYVESDNFRVNLVQRADRGMYDLFVQFIPEARGPNAQRPALVTFDGCDMVFQEKEEGVILDPGADSMISFEPTFMGHMAEMFAAIAQAFGHRCEGFEDGLLQGQNHVLWEWVRSMSREGYTARPAGGGTQSRVVNFTPPQQA